MILLISAVFPPEPVVSASLSFDLANALSEKTEVTVLSPKPSRPLGYPHKVESLNEKGYKHIILDSFTYPNSKIVGRAIESYSFGRCAADYIDKYHSKISCVYVNSWPLLSQSLIVKASKKNSIPIVIHVQDIYPESITDKFRFLKKLFTRFLIPIDKYSLKNATKVVTISPKMKNFLLESRGLEDSAVEMISNWQDEERFKPFQNSSTFVKKKPCFTFMFLGNLNKTAAIKTIIYAFIKSRLNNSRLIIAGNGSEKELLKSLTVGYPGTKIEFWEAPQDKVPEIQDNADILLVNLKKGAAEYALPSKLPAYMFSRKPIIACVDDESDTANAIKQADCGWLVPPENTDELIKSMRNAFYTNDKDLQRLGINGLNYAIKNFSKKENLKKLIDVVIKTAAIKK